MEMSSYKGIVQAHEIGIEIADILEKYGMNSEEVSGKAIGKFRFKDNPWF